MRLGQAQSGMFEMPSCKVNTRNYVGGGLAFAALNFYSYM
jgi:hypothetical protein